MTAIVTNNISQPEYFCPCAVNWEEPVNKLLTQVKHDLLSKVDQHVCY